MAASLSQKLVERIPEANGRYHRLVLAVGPARSGKTAALNDLASAHAWHRINVNLQLAERLLELTQKQRAVRAAGILDDLVRASAADVVLLDNLEMLFAVELAQDPLRLLQSLSRHRTVLASWPGSFDGSVLTYAEPGHREFKKYSNPDAVVVHAIEAPTTDTAIHQGDHA